MPGTFPVEITRGSTLHMYVLGFAVVFEDDGKVNSKERKNRAKRANKYIINLSDQQSDVRYLRS